MSGAERFSRSFARHKHLFSLLIGLPTLFFAWQLRHLEIFTQFLDLVPRGHPFVETYSRYRDVFGNANTVVVAVVAKQGDLYQTEVLRAVDRATELVDSSIVDPEVNRRPASDFVAPAGAVARLVHAVVNGVDHLFATGETGPGQTGVDHAQVASLTHITTRDPRVTQEGLLQSPLLVEEIPTTKDGLDDLRSRVRRNPAVFGVLVSTDERAALVRAGFIESRVDYAALFKHLQQTKRTLEADYPVEVWITGQPVLFGWTYAFASELLLIFALTIAVSTALLWLYFRRLYGILLPLLGAVVNVIWGLGFAAWLGFNLDPLVLVVPMLITARAISHSVQFVERFYEEYEALGDKDEACIRSMAELLLPGTLGILTDALGLLTIAVASIPVVRHLGLVCAFWAASIAVTEMLLNRLLILYLPPPRERRHFVPRAFARLLELVGRIVASPRSAALVVAAFALASLGAAIASRHRELGESHPGSPLLYPDSEFNRAAAHVGEHFFGLDDLVVIAEASVPGRVITPDAFKLVESLQRALELDPEVGGSLSLVDLQKQTSRTFHQNDPRWAIWMQTPAEIAGLLFLLEAGAPVPGLLDPYRTPDGLALAVRVFFADHHHDTVSDAIARAESFQAAERLDGSLAIRLAPPAPGRLDVARRWLSPILPPAEPVLVVTAPAPNGGRRSLPVQEKPFDGRDDRGAYRVVATFSDPALGAAAEMRHRSLYAPYELWVRDGHLASWHAIDGGAWTRDGVTLRLAAGSIGIQAASNEAVAASDRLGLLVAFTSTFLVLLVSYRSGLVGALLLASLGTAALTAMAVQAWLGIATDVNTLPVQVVGVGVGVDYAIYVIDRIRQEKRRGLPLPEALSHAVRTTGLAVTFTATTLVLGIAFWIPISSMRFSAQMSLLLCVLMGVNALGALLLVPAVLRLLPERWQRSV
ncbi:MAG TPA: MMPL family transporter [Myxococcota bacterium]|jgi:predicted RND superfamily exporter protein|nr:MMPL family transporter [Myxococcota bacterium]